MGGASRWVGGDSRWGGRGSRWGGARVACVHGSNAPPSFQPDPARSGLAAAVALGTLRAEDRGAAEVPPPSPLRDGGQPGGREGVGRRTPQRAGTARTRPRGGDAPPLPSVRSEARADTAGPCDRSLSLSCGELGTLFSEAALWGRRRWVCENLARATRAACACGGGAWEALLTGRLACGASPGDFSRQPCCSSSGRTLSTCPSGSDTEGQSRSARGARGGAGGQRAGASCASRWTLPWALLSF